LLLYATKLPAFSYKVVVDGSKKVRKAVFEGLSDERITCTVKKLISSDDLVLRLEAVNQRMTRVRRDRGAPIPRRRFVYVVRDSDPSVEERPQSFRVRCLTERFEEGNFHSICDIDEAVFA